MKRLAVALVVVLAGCSGGGADDSSTTTTSGTTNTAAATTSTSAETPSTAVRQSAPDFTLQLGDGGSYTLSEGTKPVYLVFWAEW
jgi:hypothetical protein